MINLSIRKKNELTKKKKKGFTLIELIIVIAIIAILAAIALPRFGQIRENGNVKADIATAKNIETAVQTAIANGDITLDSSGDATVTVSSVMSGTVPKVKASSSGHAGADFTASVSGNVVHVGINGGQEIFPTPVSPYNLS
ncbi:prepilin-type N-terminal cleavage/methylation domain-containing protein [Clostridium sp.]|uniref:prepilin-type N-terminal cleavage/methylation domain-containing protein n=1 Tax=Clostridium sp. TaxID=1506 RepID=UPI00261EC947|nr:prepilin-type N-terminal cleavage/methylation domain-containing protein [Clostridium sp.]